MKKLFFLLVIAFAGKFCCAQTQAEIEKKMKETQQQIDKIKNDPKYKELMKSMSNLDSLKKNMSHGTITTIPKTKVNDTVSTAFPVVNNLLLQALPLRVFNKAELISYLHNLNSKLTTLLHTSYGTDINTIAPETIHLSGTSIAFWLSGKPYESALIALKAAEMSPDNIVLLNNTGGILASSGLSVNAIPVLEYANQHLPGNNMILNNLGQAYFSLGDLKKAEKYLLESVSTAIYYPDANLTLAYIYNKKGDKGNAIRYAENSLRGAYSADAEYLLLKLNPAAKLMDYIRHRYKQPEFFNYHKYPLLPQCVKVSQASTLKPQYDAYAQMLWDLDAKYRELAKQENDIAKKTVPDIMTKAIKEQRSPYRPFG